MKRIASEKCLTISIVIVDEDGRQCKLLLALIFNHFAWYWNGINHENLAYPVVCVLFYCTICRLGCNSIWNILCVCAYDDFSAHKLEVLLEVIFHFTFEFFFSFAPHSIHFDNVSTAQPIPLFDKKDRVHNIWNVHWNVFLTISIQFTHVLVNLEFFCISFLFSTFRAFLLVRFFMDKMEICIPSTTQF